MLLLERCRDAAVCIGGGIVVRVLRTSRSRVLLGIEADKGVPIWREELGPPAQNLRTNEQSRDLRVLLVEDDAGHQRLIAGTLAECGVRQITMAGSAEAAQSMLEKADGAACPHLVLLDMLLPGRSGLDLLRSLRQSDSPWRRVPVVMLSSADDEEQIDRCLEAGANAYVRKSADFAEFRDSVARTAEFWKSTRHVA